MTQFDNKRLHAPFPYPGGKTGACRLVWPRFGDPPNYCEPFFGSGAVLFGRPSVPKTETVNDLDCHIVNVWRAIQYAPEETAKHADWIVSEVDMIARNRYLIRHVDEVRKGVRGDPKFCNPELAGWWIWGANVWIASGWCQTDNEKLPHLGDPGRGVNRRLPHLGDPGTGVNRRLPHLGDPGRGVNRRLPHLGDPGKGVNRRLPHLGDPGTGVNRRLDAIRGWFHQLSERLRTVRVTCGEWDRVLTPSVTTRHGATAVFLDPPYDGYESSYSITSSEVGEKVREWAVANGNNPNFRIALCGYEDARFSMPTDWECVPWKAHKGYQLAEATGKHGGYRERIWFSPHCLRGKLF